MLLIPKRWLIGAAIAAWVVVLNFEHEGGLGSLDDLGGATGTEQQTGIRDLAPCMVRVDADELNVRTGPGTRFPVVGTLDDGAIVPAARDTEGTFRQLGPGRWIGRWVSDEYLDPLPGARCD